MRTRTHARILFGALLAILALSAASCKKPAPQAPPPPPPPQAAPPAKPTANLSASPNTIQRGESVTLTWSSTNATTLSVSPGIGNVSAEGTQSVSPTNSTTYTLTATGPGGSADATVRVTVTAPPPPPVAQAPTLQEIFDKEVKDAFYEYDKADIRADARDALSATATFLRAYPQVKIVLEGHCDERGSTEYNLGLGDRRAAAVKQYLISQGISADRLNTVSFGKEKPFCTESTEECWQKNRRGHFVKAN